MKNWENLFEKHILERGYRYYSENAVENLDISADVIRADVIGPEDYEVEISLEDDGGVAEMYCSCSYVDDGRNFSKSGHGREEGDVPMVYHPSGWFRYRLWRKKP